MPCKKESNIRVVSKSRYSGLSDWGECIDASERSQRTT